MTDNLYFRGLLKLYGVTVGKDVEGAASAFENAAALGHADAQTALGVMKMKGFGKKYSLCLPRFHIQLFVQVSNGTTSELLICLEDLRVKIMPMASGYWGGVFIIATIIKLVTVLFLQDVDGRERYSSTESRRGFHLCQ